jgi:hypothetical protein
VTIAAEHRLGRAGHVRQRPKADGTGLEWGGAIDLAGGGAGSDFSADDLAEAKTQGRLEAKACGWAVDVLAWWEPGPGDSYVLHSIDDHDGRLGTG